MVSWSETIVKLCNREKSKRREEQKSGLQKKAYQERPEHDAHEECDAYPHLCVAAIIPGHSAVRFCVPGIGLA